MKTQAELLKIWREYHKANPIGILPIAKMMGLCRQTLVRFDTGSKQIGNLSLLKIERFLDDWEETQFIKKAH